MKYLQLKTLRKGDRFAESCYGHKITLEAIEDAHEVRNEARKGHVCRARVIGSNMSMPLSGDAVVPYFEAHDAGAYSLKLKLVSRAAARTGEEEG